MPVAAGTEDPGTIPLVRIRLGIEYARNRQVTFVDLSVFGVNVEYAGAKLVNVQDGINELAEEVAGILFDAEIFAF